MNTAAPSVTVATLFHTLGIIGLGSLLVTRSISFPGWLVQATWDFSYCYARGITAKRAERLKCFSEGWNFWVTLFKGPGDLMRLL